MRVVGLLPAASLSLGVAVGLVTQWPHVFGWVMPFAVAIAAAGWGLRWARVTSVALVLGFAAAGAAAAVHSQDAALHTPLRRVLHETFGGFAIETLGPPGGHDPVPTPATILEDASARDGFVSLRAAVRDVRLDGRWRAATGRVALSVSGTVPPGQVARWTAGRAIEAPVTFRRPARYLDDGVADFERDLALDGTTLLGSVKSGLLIDVQTSR